MDAPNPYQSPAETGFRADAVADDGGLRKLRIHVAWAVVYVMNLALPLLLSRTFMREHGKLGMALAIALFLITGWAVCIWSRVIAAPAIVGGAVLGFMQLLPIIQIVAGMVGLAVAVKLGMARDGHDDGMELITSELGGFVVTFVTGGILICASFVMGLLIRLVTPARWWAMRPSLLSR